MIISVSVDDTDDDPDYEEEATDESDTDESTTDVRGRET